MTAKNRVEIVVTVRASQHIAKADEWWRANRLEAPNAIREELQNAYDLISLQPRSGASAQSPTLGGVRRVLLARIGFFVYYRVRPRLGRIEIVAFWHARRGVGP